MNSVGFPYHFDHRRRTATAAGDPHIRQLIEQLLFTAPGERVNRPEFGTGLLQLVFAPNSEQLGAATQMLVQAALQQWLGELIQVEAVEVAADDSTLRVAVRYLVRRTQTSELAEFTQQLESA